MTRNWILTASPVALLMVGSGLMFNCSSSSTTTTPDAGHASSTSASGKGSSNNSSGASTSSGSKGTTTTSSPSSNASSPSGSSSEQSSGSGTGTTSSSGSTSAGGFNASAGDIGAKCVPPVDGGTCHPGKLSCGTGTTCDVGSQQCCQLSNPTSYSCQSTGGACAGAIVTCDEAADCSDNKICCLDVTSVSGAGTVSCQAGPTCPAGGGIAAAQVCLSDNECANGKCTPYSCSATNPPTIIQACSTPAGLLGATCTAM